MSISQEYEEKLNVSIDLYMKNIKKKHSISRANEIQLRREIRTLLLAIARDVDNFLDRMNQQGIFIYIKFIYLYLKNFIGGGGGGGGGGQGGGGQSQTQ